jgi:hypothetical protein
MQSERPNAVSRNLPVATEHHTDLRANQHAKSDTRRFAGIFPPEAPEVVSVDCGDGIREEQKDSDALPRSESVAAPEKNTPTTQAASVASVDEGSALSASQQIIACYRAVHGNDHAPECATTETRENGLSRISDDQRSMYTLAASADTQSTMDMMWRPKPKVHMCHTDQRALMQAVRYPLTRISHWAEYTK